MFLKYFIIGRVYTDDILDNRVTSGCWSDGIVEFSVLVVELAVVADCITGADGYVPFTIECIVDGQLECHSYAWRVGPWDRYFILTGFVVLKSSPVERQVVLTNNGYGINIGWFKNREYKLIGVGTVVGVSDAFLVDTGFLIPYSVKECRVSFEDSFVLRLEFMWEYL